MKTSIITLIASSLSSLSLLVSSSPPVEFVFVIPSYNNEPWCLKTISSCVNQTYPHWELYYVNDASTDRTGELIDQFVNEHNLQDKCTVIHNTQREGNPLANFYKAIHLCDPHKIIVQVDGDDWLSNDHVLETLAAVYQDPAVWLTYGNYASTDPTMPSICMRFPSAVTENNEFRSYPFIASHLRTFYAKLFHLVQKEDLLFEGRFAPLAGDFVLMLPMLEMASQGHIHFIEDVLLIYNAGNPINESKAYTYEHFLRVDGAIRSRAKYMPLAALF